ncbi:MAG: hypothetical protein MHM6MM_004309 [Cercozoa sp. M6MM]
MRLLAGLLAAATSASALRVAQLSEEGPAHTELWSTEKVQMQVQFGTKFHGASLLQDHDGELHQVALMKIDADGFDVELRLRNAANLVHPLFVHEELEREQHYRDSELIKRMQQCLWQGEAVHPNKGKGYASVHVCPHDDEAVKVQVTFGNEHYQVHRGNIDAEQAEASARKNPVLKQVEYVSAQSAQHFDLDEDEDEPPMMELLQQNNASVSLSNPEGFFIKLWFVTDKKRLDNLKLQAKELGTTSEELALRSVFNTVLEANHRSVLSEWTISPVTYVLRGHTAWSNGDPDVIVHEDAGNGNGEINHGPLLSSFRTWARSVRIIPGSRSIPNSDMVYSDHVALMSGENFAGSVIGLAYVGTLCGSSAASINMDYRSGYGSNVATVVHEVGHGMNMPHTPSDIDGKPCERGPMGGGSGLGDSFTYSNCSIKAFEDRIRAGGFTCVMNGQNYLRSAESDIILRRSKCGDGIVQAWEQCDKLLDPCCRDDCTLGAKSCSAAPGNDCCDASTCQLKSAGTSCMFEMNGDSCGVATQCSGELAQCPPPPAGAKCSVDFEGASYDGYCMHNECISADAWCKAQGKEQRSMWQSHQSRCDNKICTSGGTAWTWGSRPDDGWFCGESSTAGTFCYDGECRNSTWIANDPAASKANAPEVTWDWAALSEWSACHHTSRDSCTPGNAFDTVGRQWRIVGCKIGPRTDKSISSCTDKVPYGKVMPLAERECIVDCGVTVAAEAWGTCEANQAALKRAAAEWRQREQTTDFGNYTFLNEAVVNEAISVEALCGCNTDAKVPRQFGLQSRDTSFSVSCQGEECHPAFLQGLQTSRQCELSCSDYSAKDEPVSSALALTQSASILLAALVATTLAL